MRFFVFALLLHILLFTWKSSRAPQLHFAKISAESPATPESPYAGKCLKGQLALARAGDLRAASQTPFVGSAAHPLAVFMPLHPPGFHDAVLTLEAATTTPFPGWALFFVFSNAKDSAAFEAFLIETNRSHLAKQFGVLDLSWNVQTTEWIAEAAKRAISGLVVPYKTYHAEAILGACYEMLVHFDNELEWLRPQDLISAMRQRVASGRLLAGYAPRYRSIGVSTTAFFSAEHKAALVERTRDFNLFSYWSEPVVYLGRDMAEWLHYAGYPARRLVTDIMEFTNAYELWKVARGEYSVHDLSFEIDYKPCGSLETLSILSYYETIRQVYPPGPRWLNKAFCLRYPTACVNNSALVLLFHTDRGEWALKLAENHECCPQCKGSR